ncbi:hypothetical protein FIBSPDRAFT_887241 [Athelia psychrophila]|uniref:BAH domain-containing protein n=1 Tax=Athelia psychrophila TaxID=1759441 RepID=A0A166PTW7_9AGAM|nr:hypothetical protein FIBSPDRAFT_887241 [Fibularhizoctonia sp. CBS 109695]
MSTKSRSRSSAKKGVRRRVEPTPTTRTWSRLDHWQSVKYGGEAYRVGDIVNLAHDSLDSQDLWDARITGIGKKVTQSGTSTWLRVNWFYTAQQINDLKAYSNANWDITAIAPRERVYSNHEGFVSIGSAEGVSDLVQFDERKADIREITGIYYRWAIDIKGGTFQDQHFSCKPKCPLKGIYKPDRMRQRYCQKCLIWYHLGCVKLVPDEQAIATEAIAGTSSEDDRLDSLIRLPIERGFLAGIAGNGQVQLALRDHAKKGQPLVGNQEFTTRYLALFAGREMYHCPEEHLVI